MWQLEFKKVYYLSRRDTEVLLLCEEPGKTVIVEFERIAPIVQLMKSMSKELVNLKQL